MPSNLKYSLPQGLARVSFALGVGQFLCLPPLYIRYSSYPAHPNFWLYMGAIALSGVLLLGIGYFARDRGWHRRLASFCLAVLFLETTLFLLGESSLYRPVTMLFPLLASVATPILNRRRASYALASVSALLLLGLHFFYFREGVIALPGLTLLHVVLFFSAFLAETLWEQLRTREKLLEQKKREMETWVERLGHASSLISTGHVAPMLPGPPPSHVFDELTRSVGQMQEKLNQHFTNLFLQDRLSSLGELASGVAHELNTPLTTLHFIVAGNDQLPEELKTSLITEIERMSEITRSLLSFARPHDEEEMDLNQIIRGCERLLRQSLRERCELELKLGNDELPVRTHSNEIQQVLLNLIHNSLDAMEGVNQPKLVLSTGKSATSGWLRVTDNGSGISKDNLSKIMNPFYTTKAPGKGTGLGLYIVHQIAQRHGARVSIESQVGQGTTIEMTFPLLTKNLSEVA